MSVHNFCAGNKKYISTWADFLWDQFQKVLTIHMFSPIGQGRNLFEDMLLRMK